MPKQKTTTTKTSKTTTTKAKATKAKATKANEPEAKTAPGPKAVPNPPAEAVGDKTIAVAKFTRKTAASTVERFLKALEKEAKGLGLTIRVESLAYTHSTIAIGATAVLKELGDEFGPEREAYLNHAHKHGLHPSWLDTDFESPFGGAFTIVGLSEGTPERPVIVRDVSTGLIYRYPVDSVIYQPTAN